jgi:hypothetical protein
MKFINKDKTNVRAHNRRCKNVEAGVKRHTRRISGRIITGRVQLKNLNYPQAKKRFPFLEPYGDADEDGVINKKDCHPFDVKRQDDDAQDLIDNSNDFEEREEFRRPQFEGTPEEQEQANQNISDILAGQNRKERKGGWWI